jgi:enterochelin esterase-like enzyme
VIGIVAASPRIVRLLRDLDVDGPVAVDKFWREAVEQGTPLIEAEDADSALVTFVWRGEAAITRVRYGLNVDLQRIPGTDLWYGSQRLPLDLRTIYWVDHADGALPSARTDGAPAHPDLANPKEWRFPPDRTVPGDRPYYLSILELPAAPPEPWTSPQPGAARGAVLQTSIRTAALGGRRRISVYRPAGPRDRPLALLVVFDGSTSKNVLRIPTVLDNLIAAGRIPPTIALFVNSTLEARRCRELTPRPHLRQFVVHELMPRAQRRWRISSDPADRVIAGASLGGLAAAYVAMEAPHLFGAVVSQSGSFWWPEQPATERERLTRAYAARPRLPLRFYLDIGSHETLDLRGDGLHQLAVNRRFRDTLLERGYPVTYAEYSGAHDYINWRRTFADGLLAVLGDRVS